MKSPEECSALQGHVQTLVIKLDVKVFRDCCCMMPQ